MVKRILNEVAEDRIQKRRSKLSMFSLGFLSSELVTCKSFKNPSTAETSADRNVNGESRNVLDKDVYIHRNNS